MMLERYMHIFSVALLVLVSFSSQPVLAKDSGTTDSSSNSKETAHGEIDRRSPYFVDGVHCEGFEGTLREEELKKIFADEESAEIGVRSAYQDQCESLFSFYGLKKFQWVTPSDLEKLSFSIRHGGKFEKSEIRIEKSDLPNHIHVVGNFKLVKAQTYFVGDLKSEVMLDLPGASRLTNSGEISVEINRRGLNNAAPYTIGVEYFSTYADSALKPDEIGTSEFARTNFTKDETEALEKRNGKYLGFNLRINPNGIGLTSLSNEYFVDFGISKQSLIHDDYEFSGNRYGIGYVFQPEPLRDQTFTLHAFYADVAPKVSETLVTDTLSDPPEVRSFGVAFIGLEQQYENPSFSLDFEAYRAIDSKLSAYGNWDIDLIFYENKEFGHHFGYDGNFVRGALLPEHRFGFPDRSDNRVFYKFVKFDYQLWNLDSEANFKVGMHEYRSQSKISHRYSKSVPFIEAAINAYKNEFDINLALTIDAGRSI